MTRIENALYMLAVVLGLVMIGTGSWMITIGVMIR